MKTGDERVDDAIDFIFGIGKAELANHLQGIVKLAGPSKIGKELSLGSRSDGKDDPAYGANTQKRRALRALLLCQRVYFSDLWAEAILVGGVRQRTSFLDPDWKADSLRHWGAQSEAQIVEGILMFAVTTADVSRLADAADQQPSGNHPDLTLTHLKTPFPGLISCYGAVMTWLLRSGLVSYRWYMRNSGASNKTTLREAFGPASVIWDGGRTFATTDSLPLVPRGHIVHLYVDNPIRWNGHWLVSLGDGYARACNNDDTDGTNRIYTDRCSLNNQFKNGYKHASTSGVGEEPGVAEVINPAEIPGRI